MNRKEPVKTEIPWALHIQIVKLQGKLESSYTEACLEASKLMDPNGLLFEKAVKAEARRLENSSLMKTVNKNRKTWIRKGYDKGFGEGKEQGHRQAEQAFKITYPCSICHEGIVMYPESQDHKAMQSMMTKAGWRHTSCNQRKR